MNCQVVSPRSKHNPSIKKFSVYQVVSIHMQMVHIAEKKII